MEATKHIGSEKPDHQSLFMRLVIVVVVLLISYPLSAGPAMRLAQKHFLSRSSFEMIYGPLFQMADHSKVIDGALGWYVSLWMRPVVCPMVKTQATAPPAEGR